jgi:hypothetical protein
MRIIAFGSSHTTGYRLDDIKHLKINAISKFAYPQITADLLNCECLNLGRTGNGLDQIYSDVFGYLTDSRSDDFLIIQLPTNPSWFRLITSENDSINIVKPDSLDYKGRKFKDALHQYYGVLTGDNHWNRLWYINFYSLINLLHSRNIKFVWFFDSYSTLWEEYDTVVSKMPDDIQIEIHKLRSASPDPKLSYINTLFADYLFKNIPQSLKPCGHHDESGHKYWAEKVLVPIIQELSSV